MIRSPRRHKTIEITVEGPGEVVVAAPVRTPAPKIEAVVRRRAGWILRHEAQAARALHARRFVSGESLPYLGRLVRMWVREGPLPRVELRSHHWQFDVTVPAGLSAGRRRAAVARTFEDWYRQHALAHLVRRTAVLAARLGVRPAGVLVRDQRRRWGSCSPGGTLRFNWRIVMTPPALIDYVIAHELAHLSDRTHGAAYWALVASIIPDHRERRRRLREVGPHLTL